MAADLDRFWRRIWRNPRHPKVREERIKALGSACHNGGLALLVGAGAAPFLNPALEPPTWARLLFFARGVVLVVAGQVLLGYIVDEETSDE